MISSITTEMTVIITQEMAAVSFASQKLATNESMEQTTSLMSAQKSVEMALILDGMNVMTETLSTEMAVMTPAKWNLDGDATMVLLQEKIHEKKNVVMELISKLMLAKTQTSSNGTAATAIVIWKKDGSAQVATSPMQTFAQKHSEMAAELELKNEMTII